LLNRTGLRAVKNKTDKKALYNKKKISLDKLFPDKRSGDVESYYENFCDQSGKLGANPGEKRSCWSP